MRNLEADTREDLAEARIAAVELIEAPEQRIARRKIAAAGDLSAARDIAEITTRVLSMVQDVEELAADFKVSSLAKIETLGDAQIYIVSRLQRECVAAAVR